MQLKALGSCPRALWGICMQNKLRPHPPASKRRVAEVLEMWRSPTISRKSEGQGVCLGRMPAAGATPGGRWACPRVDGKGSKWILSTEAEIGTTWLAVSSWDELAEKRRAAPAGRSADRAGFSRGASAPAACAPVARKGERRPVDPRRGFRAFSFSGSAAGTGTN